MVRPELKVDPWPGCLTLAAELFPGMAMVGYESGVSLTAARRHGFEAVRPLRVWLHGEEAM